MASTDPAPDAEPGGGPTAASPAGAEQPGLTGDDVARLGRLARIELSGGERRLLAGQLSVILDAVASLQGVVTPDVPATSHPVPLTNVWRDDVPAPSLAAVEALSGAPAIEAERFRVPRILEED